MALSRWLQLIWQNAAQLPSQNPRSLCSLSALPAPLAYGSQVEPLTGQASGGSHHIVNKASPVAAALAGSLPLLPLFFHQTGQRICLTINCHWYLAPGSSVTLVAGRRDKRRVLPDDFTARQLRYSCNAFHLLHYPALGTRVEERIGSRYSRSTLRASMDCCGFECQKDRSVAPAPAAPRRCGRRGDQCGALTGVETRTDNASCENGREAEADARQRKMP
jgi:hypothetical protein